MLFRSVPTDTLRINCQNARSLIEDAYIRFAEGKNRSPTTSALIKMEGGPGWINTDQYTIEAKSELAQPVTMKVGPMMQGLLEDRFQLKVHRETREGTVYELKIAKGGPKLQPAKQGPCVPADFAGLPMPPMAPGDRQCNLMWTGRIGANAVSIARSVGMEDFAAMLTAITGQLVIDKTGINERIDYRLIYFPEDGTSALAADAAEPNDAPAASIFTVVQQEMGLKLERARGPREYLVIDHMERPSEN